jgi:hypothetical protein
LISLKHGERISGEKHLEKMQRGTSDVI